MQRLGNHSVLLSNLTFFVPALLSTGLQISGFSNPTLTWVLWTAAGVLYGLNVMRRKNVGRFWGYRMPAYTIMAGLALGWLAISLVAGTSLYLFWTGKFFAMSEPQLAEASKELPIKWENHLSMTPGDGAIKALQFRGFNLSDGEVSLTSASIISSVNGHQVLLSADAGPDGIIPINELNLIPAKAPIVLVAEFVPPVAHGQFIDEWKKFTFNAEYAGTVYRFTYDEAMMSLFFPGKLGPRLSKKKTDK